MKIKFYEAQTRLYRQKAKKLKKSPEGKEIGEILSYNTFGQSEEECIKEQKEEFNKKFEELLKKSLEQ